MDINLDELLNNLSVWVSGLDAVQASLIGLAVLVALVLLYKLGAMWNARSSQEEQDAFGGEEAPFSDFNSDVLAQRLLDKEAQNSAHTTPAPTPAPTSTATPVPASTPTASMTLNHEPSSATVSTAPSLPAELYPAIDWISLLTLPTAVSVRDLLTYFNEQLPTYTHPVLVYLLDAVNLQWQRWDKVHADLRVIRIASSIQWVNRDGVLSASDFARWNTFIEQLAHTLGADIEQQKKSDALAMATELDAFCVEVDKTISLHIVSDAGNPFAGTKLKGLAEAHGFTLNRGVFTYVSQNETPSLTLFNYAGGAFDAEALRGETLRGVTLCLDIPHAKQGTVAFQQMLNIARQMAASLNGKLMDAKREPLQEAQIEKMSQLIKQIHTAMLSHNIVPGSACASRLFS